MRTAGRLGLALCVASMSACLKDGSGSGQSQTGLGANTPLVWVDQSAGAVGGGGTTLLTDVWIDATTVTATGAGAILPSIDEVTYGFPVGFLPPTDANVTHPLVTHSSAAAVVSPEDSLLTLINNYRLQTLGGLGGGAGGLGGLGGGGLGGGLGGGIQITAIPPSGKLRKCARAHSKHYGRFHVGALPLTNAETDTVNAGGPTALIANKPGRLRKGNVMVTGVLENPMSGAGLVDSQAAFDALLNGGSAVLTSTAYNYIGIGHWPQGDQVYYWDIILGSGVNPVN